MARASMEIRLACLELGMQAALNRVPAAIEKAKEMLAFIEEAPDNAIDPGQPAPKRGRPGKAAGETAGKAPLA